MVVECERTATRRLPRESNYCKKQIASRCASWTATIFWAWLVSHSLAMLAVHSVIGEEFSTRVAANSRAAPSEVHAELRWAATRVDAHRRCHSTDRRRFATKHEAT